MAAAHCSARSPERPPKSWSCRRHLCATAVSEWLPFAAAVVSQETENGDCVSSAPRTAPSSLNWTPVTATLSDAPAATLTEPVTTAPPTGADTATVGGVVSGVESVSVTGTDTGDPWAPDAVTVTVPLYVSGRQSGDGRRHGQGCRRCSASWSDGEPGRSGRPGRREGECSRSSVRDGQRLRGRIRPSRRSAEREARRRDGKHGASGRRGIRRQRAVAVTHASRPRRRQGGEGRRDARLCGCSVPTAAIAESQRPGPGRRQHGDPVVDAARHGHARNRHDVPCPGGRRRELALSEKGTRMGSRRSIEAHDQTGRLRGRVDIDADRGHRARPGRARPERLGHTGAVRVDARLDLLISERHGSRRGRCTREEERQHDRHEECAAHDVILAGERPSGESPEAQVSSQALPRHPSSAPPKRVVPRQGSSLGFLVWMPRRSARSLVAGRESTSPPAGLRPPEGHMSTAALDATPSRRLRADSSPPNVFVVPAYNEADNLPRLFADLEARPHLFPPASLVLIVDDGSAGRHAGAGRGVRRSAPGRARPARRNQGPGAAFRAGFDAALDAIAPTRPTSSRSRQTPRATSMRCRRCSLAPRTGRTWCSPPCTAAARWSTSTSCAACSARGAGVAVAPRSASTRGRCRRFFRVYRASMLRARVRHYGDGLIGSAASPARRRCSRSSSRSARPSRRSPSTSMPRVASGESKMRMLPTIAGYWRLLTRSAGSRRNRWRR